MEGIQVQGMPLPGQLLAKLLARPILPWTASYYQLPIKWRISLQISCDR